MAGVSTSLIERPRTRADSPPQREHEPGDRTPVAALAWAETPEPEAVSSEWRPVRDALLTVATLGLYRCWVRTRLRRRVWSSLRLHGVPLGYTGTVRDLLVPALAALGGLALVALAVLVMKHFAVPRPRLTPSPWRFVVTVPLVYLLGLAAFRHRAFLLERTTLGSQSAALDGSPHAYAIRHLVTAFAVGLTLGWIVPWRQVALHRRLMGATRIGPHRFTFEGGARPLLKRFAVAWVAFMGVYLGAVLTLGLAMGPKIVAAREAMTWPQLTGTETAVAGAVAVLAGAAVWLICAWYRIGSWRHLAAMTRLDGRPLRLDVRSTDYLKLAAANALLSAATLMLAKPHAEWRHLRFVLSRLRIAG
jgi:uncharacterized membrane protein YjgN (DUF898 family)